MGIVLGLLAAIVALVAVVLISTSHDDDGKFEFATAGVKEAVASGLTLGAFYLLLAHAGQRAGFYPLITARLASMMLLMLIALIARQSVRPAKGAIPLIGAAGGIDMMANALYVLATFHGYVSIAAVLTSLYPASTVMLAWIVLKERLQAIQYTGLFCALVGVMIIAL